MIEVHSPLLCVQLYVVGSNHFEPRANLVGRWNLSISAEKAPGAHERGNGHVECAFTGAAVLDAIGQELERLR